MNNAKTKALQTIDLDQLEEANGGCGGGSGYGWGGFQGGGIPQGNDRSRFGTLNGGNVQSFLGNFNFGNLRGFEFDGFDSDSVPNLGTLLNNNGGGTDRSRF